MKPLAAAAYLAACAASCICAQTAPPAFDVASVHPAAPEDKREGNARPHHIHTTPGNVVMRSVGMTEAIQWAYNVESYQVSGPNWMPQTRFDIVAKAGGPATEDEMRVMMQTLLANRFALQAHREDKEMAGMALLVAKGGPKLKAADGEGDSVFEPVPKKMAIKFGRMSMHEFAALLSEPMRKPVLDFTEMPGTFDFMLDASKLVPPDPAPGQAREDNDSYLILNVLPEQLGLRLEPRKLTLNMVVVDHIEKVPTEN
jgi:uncharacterized protein (TIGR03435 family)